MGKSVCMRLVYNPCKFYVCVFLSCFSGDDMSLLVTEKVKQTVKVPDVSMDTSQDGEHNEDTELVVLVSFLLCK